MAENKANKKESGKKEKGSTATNKKRERSDKIGKDPAGSREERDVLEMNLAEGQIINYFDWKRGGGILASVIILILIILGGVYWGISMWGDYRAEKNEFFSEKSEKMEEQIEHLQENTQDAFIYKQKLQIAEMLLDDHVYWTNFFELLEDRTFSDVYYIGFQGDIKGQYTISTQARDLSMIDSQVQYLQEADMIKDAKVRGAVNAEEQSAEGQGEGVAFDLELKVEPGVFYSSN